MTASYTYVRRCQKKHKRRFQLPIETYNLVQNDNTGLGTYTPGKSIAIHLFLIIEIRETPEAESFKILYLCISYSYISYFKTILRIKRLANISIHPITKKIPRERWRTSARISAPTCERFFEECIVKLNL